MHIGYIGKGAFLSSVGYTAKGAGIAVHTLGTGLVKAGTILQDTGDTMKQFGDRYVNCGSACFKASSVNCDPTKMTDEELVNTGLSEQEVSEIRTAQAAAPAKKQQTDVAASVIKDDETIEVTPEEAAAALV